MKYLIKMPSEDLLSTIEGSEIEQIYITASEKYDGERVRKRKYADKTVYTHTKKKRLTAMSAIEDETEISEDEYLRLAENIESGTNPIIKKRYVLPYRGYAFEIDVYSFWSDIAVMEVELPSETAKFELPPEISVLRDVTADSRYKNHALAKRVPSYEG